MLITSRQNPLVKLLRSLKEAHGRKKAGLFVVEGASFAAEALESDWEVEHLVLTPAFAESEKGKPLLRQASERGVEVVLLSPSLFEQVSDTQTPPGVLAVVRQKPEEAERLKLPQKCSIIVLEEVQDPTNVGAILRVAEAAGCAGVLCTKGTADKYNPKVIRASAGSVLRVPTVTFPSHEKLQAFLIGNEFQIIAAVPHGGVSLYEAEFYDRLAFVLGNEARGISAKMMSLVELKVTIPMQGKVKSLNVATACAVLLYEAMRRRMQAT